MQPKEQGGRPLFELSNVVKKQPPDAKPEPNSNIEEELDPEIEKLRLNLSETTTLMEQNLAILSPAYRRKWTEACNSIRSIDDAKLTMAEKMRKHANSEISPIYINVESLMYAAQALIILEKYDKLGRIAKDNNFSNQYDSLNGLMGFASCGYMLIRFNGLCLKDVLKSSISPVSFFDFSMKTYEAKSKLICEEDPTFGKIIKENEQNLPDMASYPLLSQHHFRLAMNCALALNVFTPSIFNETIERIFPHPQEGEKEIISKAVNAVETTYQMRKRDNEALFNPSSPLFKGLKNALTKYLEKPDEKLNLVALNLLGINNRESIISTYRKTRLWCLTKGENKHFYESLAESMKDYIDEAPEDPNDPILMSRDLDSIVNDNNPSARNTPTIKEIFGIAKNALQNYTNKDIVIENEGSDKINWGGLAKPAAIDIVVRQQECRSFVLILHYKNNESKAMDISLNFDWEKGNFDWPFTESPDDPEMQKYKNMFLVATKSILSFIGFSENINFSEEKQGKKNKQPSSGGRDGKKTKAQQTLSPIQETLQAEIQPASPENKVRTIISVDADRKIIKLMSRFPPKHQKRIIEGLRKFNQDGLGEFKPIPPIVHEGKIVYELVVSQGKGAIRVFAVEDSKPDGVTNGNGIHRFKIFDIKYRKNAS